MIVHKAKTETNKLTSFERLRRHYVSENYGIVAAVFAVDNANSSVRIKGLYDALHVGPAFAIVPSLLYPYIRHHLSAVVLSLAKTTSATKNGAILGRAGVNTINIHSTPHKHFGGQAPCPHSHPPPILL